MSAGEVSGSLGVQKTSPVYKDNNSSTQKD